MEPKRLTELSDTSQEIGRLLRTARRDRPPAELRKAAWRSIVAKSAATGIGIGAGTVTAKGSALTVSSAAGSTSTAAAAMGAPTLLSKGALVLAIKTVIVGTGLGAGAVVARQSFDYGSHVAHAVSAPKPQLGFDQSLRPSRRPSATIGDNPAAASSVSVPAPETEVAKDTARTPAAESQAANDATRTQEAGRASSRPRPTSTVSPPRKPDRGESAQLEARRVAEIRRMIRSGNGRGAIESLAGLDRECSTNLLAQEREALRIDALLQVGRRVEATNSIQRFRVQYPRSPFTTRWSTLTRSDR